MGRPRGGGAGPLLRAGALALGATLGLLLAWGAGFVWFTAAIPGGIPAGPLGTDAIVVLTGGSERLATGIALLDAGLGRKLFVSGVHRSVEVSELLRLARIERPELADRIVLGYSADDTIGNAAETAAWMQGENFRSLRLVTAGYHMRRSLIEFRRVMPEASIVPHPVFPESVKSQWWRWPGTASLLATEYTKYLAALARHQFMSKDQAP